MADVGIGHRGSVGPAGHLDDLVQRTFCTIADTEVQHRGSSDVDRISIVDSPVGASQDGTIDTAGTK